MDRDVDMDIDEPQEHVPTTPISNPSSSQPTASSSMFTSLPPGFELESYISNYSGRTAIERLTRLVSTSPSVAPEAFTLCVKKIQEGRDASAYTALCNAYEGVSGYGKLTPITELPGLDGKWIDETMRKNQAEKIKLEGELKNYSNNMIKESIRMGHRDLAQFYRSVGDYPASLKHWTKSREFCTTSQQVLDGCVQILELLIEQRNYAHLPTYIFKAESALEGAVSAMNANAAKDKEAATSLPSTKKSTATIPDIDVLRSKLDFANGLAQLSQGNYDKAAYFFLRLGSGASGLAGWFGKVVGQGDIAIYGVVCALASLSRSAFKAQVIENLPFSSYIEQEPYVREMVEAYMGSNFKGVLELMSRWNARHTLDPHLAPHTPTLLSRTRSRLVVLYFTPFSTIKLDRMAQAFGWSVSETEDYVVGLIRGGDVKGRVDGRDKVLRVAGGPTAEGNKQRDETLVNAIRAGVEMKRMTAKLLFRMKLQQLDMVIKAPKPAEGRDGRGGMDSRGQVIEID